MSGYSYIRKRFGDTTSRDHLSVERLGNVQLGTSLADLVEWADDKGLDHAGVTLTGSCHLIYMDTETDDERDDRIARQALADERREKWERETLSRLREKYGG